MSLLRMDSHTTILSLSTIPNENVWVERDVGCSRDLLLKENSLKENLLRIDLLKENSLKENLLKMDSLKENLLKENASVMNTSIMNTSMNEPQQNEPQQNEPQQWRWKKNRPAFLISSTSWTPDEDFQMLLDALVLYDRQPDHLLLQLPRLMLLITGKGPNRDSFMTLLSRLNLKRVEVRTSWLERKYYPKIVGCADLGISLHSSSSGVDLPMKVVDLFGCGKS